MPTYNFKHRETGEIIEKYLSFSQLDQWKADNPDYETIHLSAPALISGTKSAMSMAGSDWQEHLGNIKKGSGKESTIKT